MRTHKLRDVDFQATKTKPVVEVHKATAAHIPEIVDLLKYVYADADTKLNFDEPHAWEHVTGIVCNGVSFLATVDDKAVGVVMCGYIDVGYAMTTALETHHLYVLPAARLSGAAALLMDAVESFAAEQDTIAIFHQMDYHSALNGTGNNSKAVERWYKLRGYEGPVDDATVGQQGQRVGVSYRYRPESKKSQDHS